jgi:hypothetical protein
MMLGYITYTMMLGNVAALLFENDTKAKGKPIRVSQTVKFKLTNMQVAEGGVGKGAGDGFDKKRLPPPGTAEVELELTPGESRLVLIRPLDKAKGVGYSYSSSLGYAPC